jgi:hypothetical protein
MKPRTRPYVGLGDNGKRTVFLSGITPTRKKFPQFLAVIGPFRTALGARFMKVRGQNNPHCRCVLEAERLAQKCKHELQLSPANAR